jgi:hypothetical protein
VFVEALVFDSLHVGKAALRLHRHTRTGANMLGLVQQEASHCKGSMNINSESIKQLKYLL